VSERERDCVPPPHVTVQLEYVPHVPMTQSTGHAAVLQSLTSSVTGQPVPPCATGVVIVLERDCEPPPHVAVQLEYVPHALTMQSTGHAAVLHSTRSLVKGHALPPLTGSTWVRERDCAPPPHVIVHVE
jgi:hypothetical protein